MRNSWFNPWDMKAAFVLGSDTERVQENTERSMTLHAGFQKEYASLPHINGILVFITKSLSEFVLINA